MTIAEASATDPLQGLRPSEARRIIRQRCGVYAGLIAVWLGVWDDDLHVAAISSMSALDVATLRVRSLAVWFSERRAASVKTCSRSSETESSHLLGSSNDIEGYDKAQRE